MDYPRGYTVAVSIDGKLWTEDVGKGIGDEPITEIEVDTSEPIQFIRITQTGHSPNKFWSIHELGIKGMSLREPPPVPLADLASRREGVNDAYIVDSVLDPSKVIRKEFAQLKVLTAEA